MLVWITFFYKQSALKIKYYHAPENFKYVASELFSWIEASKLDQKKKSIQKIIADEKNEILLNIQ